MVGLKFGFGASVWPLVVVMSALLAGIFKHREGFDLAYGQQGVT